MYQGGQIQPKSKQSILLLNTLTREGNPERTGGVCERTAEGESRVNRVAGRCSSSRKELLIAGFFSLNVFRTECQAMCFPIKVPFRVASEEKKKRRSHCVDGLDQAHRRFSNFFIALNCVSILKWCFRGQIKLGPYTP